MMAGAEIFQRRVIQFPTPDYVQSDWVFIQRYLRRTEFLLASARWGFADRHALKLALEKVADTNDATELAFKSVAIERGLLPPSYFEEPAHRVPVCSSVQEFWGELQRDVAQHREARNPPLWRRALQHLRFH